MNVESRKAAVEEVVAEIKAGQLPTVYCVQRPYCVVVVHRGDVEYMGVAKIHWPDQWDMRAGLELALRKAAANIVRGKPVAVTCSGGVEDDE